MEAISCTAKFREFKGKGSARKIRELGYIPAILYAGKTESTAIVVNPKDILLLFKKTNSKNPVFNIKIDGEETEKKVLLKNYQVHPVKRNLLHCDFMEVAEDRPVTVDVPIKTTGRSEAEKLGAIITILYKYLKIKCLPSKIPTHIEVDVTPLMPGQSIYMEDLKLPEGVQVLYKKNIAVVGARTVKEEVIEVKPEVAAVAGEAEKPAEGEGAEAEKKEKEEETPKKEK